MAALARRLTSVLGAVMLLAAVAAPAALAQDPVAELLAMMNAERAASGLGPVALHADLIDDAQAWSQHMRESGSLSHNPDLGAVTTGWSRLGENVGVGPTTSSLHAAFMESSGHRGNLLGDYDYVGIAVVAEHPTKLWVTVVFMKALAPSVAPPAHDPIPYAPQQAVALAEQPVAEQVAAPSRPTPSPQPVPRVVSLVRIGALPIPV